MRTFEVERRKRTIELVVGGKDQLWVFRARGKKSIREWRVARKRTVKFWFDFRAVCFFLVAKGREIEDRPTARTLDRSKSRSEDRVSTSSWKMKEACGELARGRGITTGNRCRPIQSSRVRSGILTAVHDLLGYLSVASHFFCTYCTPKLPHHYQNCPYTVPAHTKKKPTQSTAILYISFLGSCQLWSRETNNWEREGKAFEILLCYSIHSRSSICPRSSHFQSLLHDLVSTQSNLFSLWGEGCVVVAPQTNLCRLLPRGCHQWPQTLRLPFNSACHFNFHPPPVFLEMKMNIKRKNTTTKWSINQDIKYSN